MYKELIAFQIEFQKVQERTAELKAEKDRLIALREKIHSEYLEGLATDSSVKEQRAKFNEVEKVEREIRMIDDKITALGARNYDNLRRLLETAHEGHNRELQKLTDEFTSRIPEARKAKAEYLAFFLELNELVKRYQKTRNAFLQASHAIGCRDYDREFWGLPRLNLTGTYEGEDKRIGILSDEIDRAYLAGQVQPWVRLYIEHQELVESNLAALQRLKELEGNN